MESFLDFVLSLLWKVPTHALPNLVRTTPHCGNKWCNPVAPEAKKYLAKFHVFFSLMTRNETLHRVSGTNIISYASLDPPNILFISTSGVCTIFQDTRYWGKFSASWVPSCLPNRLYVQNTQIHVQPTRQHHLLRGKLKINQFQLIREMKRTTNNLPPGRPEHVMNVTLYCQRVSGNGYTHVSSMHWLSTVRKGLSN